MTHEIESLAELTHLAGDGRLTGAVVQGVDLRGFDLAALLASADVTGTLFVGCRLDSVDDACALLQRGADVVPAFTDVPYATQPSVLYTPADLAAGFDAGGFESMYDTRVYRHFIAAGGLEPGVREALGQRLHDHGIDDALGDTLAAWGQLDRLVGVMGGHAVQRGEEAYTAAALLGRALTRKGWPVVTGGGPGVMEAANLGGHLADHPDAALPEAVRLLAKAPAFDDHDPYTAAALEVRERWPSTVPADTGHDPHPDGLRYGLAVPTWLYGHEPANLFAGRIAKYFSNAVREDMILRLCRGGVVFAPGMAGTVQEVFQAATMVYYDIAGMGSTPLVFLGGAHWTDALPVQRLLAPLLHRARGGSRADVIHIVDDVDEAVAVLTG
jgi:predicted Rossmann-fold nucleotide-binding protein